MNKNHINILIVNWRGYKDPLSGGAEIATMEHAKRWVSKHGAKVTWVSPPHNVGAINEKVNGIDFIYLGSNLTRNVFTLFFKYIHFCLLFIYKYLTSYKNDYDVIIDKNLDLEYNPLL